MAVAASSASGNARGGTGSKSGLTVPNTYTQFTWAKLVLRMAGLPQTKLNIDKMVRWMADEEPPKTWYNRNNPLNVGTTIHPNGTGAFRSLWTGAHFTARALQGSNYKAIRHNLATTGSLTQFSAAVVASPWASSHYGGTPQHIARTPIPTPYTAKGSKTGREGTAGGVTPTGTTPTCVIQFPGVAGAGAFCILKKSQAHQIAGGLLVVGGALVMLVGVGILASFGFGSRAAQSQLRKVGIGGSGGGGQPAPAPQGEEAPAPMTQADRNRQRVESLPPEVREEARRRREAYGLTGSSTRSASAAPTTPRPAPTERRPRAQATARTATPSAGQPSRKAKRPHGRTTGLGPKARARRGR